MNRTHVYIIRMLALTIMVNQHAYQRDIWWRCILICLHSCMRITFDNAKVHHKYTRFRRRYAYIRMTRLGITDIWY